MTPGNEQPLAAKGLVQPAPRRRQSPVSLAAVAAWMAAAAACETPAAAIDPFPVAVDLSAGPVLVEAQTGHQDAPFTAVIDTLSPITVVDSFPGGQGTPAVLRRQRELTVLSPGNTGLVPRARFANVSAYDVHPCGTPGVCQVGLAPALRPIGGIIGADVLARGAIRFAFARSEIYFFPDISGDDSSRSRACDAVFSQPFAGGGTIQVGGAQILFPGRRMAVGACAHFPEVNPARAPASERGVDLLLVVSTGLGVTILGESAYNRYRAKIAPPVPLPLDQLPDATVYLASGPIEAKLATISRMALVGEEAGNRGPCGELYANHVLSNDLCQPRPPQLPVDPCPCQDNALFCSTAAALELSAPLQVAVIDDLEPILQSLRSELRPARPELDGILGAAALGAVSLDVDYPNNRLVARCTTTSGCVARPQVRNRNSVAAIDACPNVP